MPPSPEQVNSRPPVPIHYLRANERVWTPPYVISLDTEAVPVPGTDPEILTLRLWDALLIERRHKKKRPLERVRKWGTTQDELAIWLTAACVGRPTVWVFCHNLSFDLTVSRLPLTLIRQGWSITDASIGGRAPWLRFARGRSRLTLVDSGSWFPIALADIGESLGLAKTPLPDSAASDEDWLARCRADVDILAVAVVQLLDWWDRCELGDFSLTGASCGWHAFRHVPSVQRILVDPDQSGVDADRRGVHGGRRGVWRVGDVNVGPLVELDITAAYPTVAAHLPLPIGRTDVFDSLPLTDHKVRSDRWSILAEVVVETDVPRYPCKVDKGVWYPVGRFKTTLAGPEIRDAAERGQLVSIGPGHTHQMGYAMQPWARWCLDTQNGVGEDVPPAAEIAAKNWGRAVIGKWAARGFDKIELGPSPYDDWSYEEGWDNGSQTRGGMVDIGGRRWWVAASSEPDNAYPAVLAFVESYVRVALSKVIDAVGDEAIIQCDTDGLIVALDRLSPESARAFDQRTSDRGPDWSESVLVQRLSDIAAPLALRVKRTYSTAHVIGPQHYEAGGKRRFAGLPSNSVRRDDGKYQGQIWPKLQWQMRHGDSRGYVRPDKVSSVSGPYATGWITAGGRVLPVHVQIGDDGANHLIPYGLTPAYVQGPALAPLQHRTLTRLQKAL